MKPVAASQLVPERVETTASVHGPSRRNVCTVPSCLCRSPSLPCRNCADHTTDVRKNSDSLTYSHVARFWSWDTYGTAQALSLRSSPKIARHGSQTTAHRQKRHVIGTVPNLLDGTGPYSARRATSGSTFVARRAGMEHASRAMLTKVTAAAAKVAGRAVRIPSSWVRSASA